MRLSTQALAGLILAGIGAVFLVVGLTFVWASSGMTQQIDQVETLPLLNTAQLSDTLPGTEAVIEGRISERNPLHTNGFTAYIRYRYKGERCSRDSDGNEDCEDIWLENERVTPALWLDLEDGRTHLSNTDYDIRNAPVTWQSTDWLIEDETHRYQGFKLDSPVFAGGIVTTDAEGRAFNATFIYGGNRQIYLTDRRGEAGTFFWMGIIFSSLGGLMVVIGGGLLLAGVFKK